MKYSMISLGFVFSLIVTTLCGQPETPLANVEFFDVTTLPIEQTIADPSFSALFNKTINPKHFRDHYLRPWHLQVDSLVRAIRQGPAFQRFFAPNPTEDMGSCQAGNYQPFPLSFIELMAQNIQGDRFPNQIVKGIITQYTDLRRLPTSEYCFQSVRNAGEGYPFDYFQQTTLWIGTPVLIIHRTLDDRWRFIVTPYGEGWVSTEAVGQMTDRLIRNWERAPWLIITKDNQSINNGHTYEYAGLGTILPYNTGGHTNGAYHEAWVPVFRKDQPIKVAFSPVPKFIGRPFPLPLTQASIQMVLAELWGGKYSWGGIDGGRDCSSTLKDYFSCFGIWLPRNSAQQAKVGKVIPIEGNQQQKESQIRNQGIPFLSIVYKRGHSMLYVGKNNSGNPLIFHNVWGLKPKLRNPSLENIAHQREQFGVFGLTPKADHISARFIIGKTVITTVSPESGFDHTQFDAFIDNIQSINLVIMP